ncbi:hypothetical protein N9N24_02405 [Candidatus Marinimicrobia bacterium]|nr:hypothetical protein [Candidatus Neomarinimicrobiota bacterium]
MSLIAVYLDNIYTAKINVTAVDTTSSNYWERLSSQFVFIDFSYRDTK